MLKVSVITFIILCVLALVIGVPVGVYFLLLALGAPKYAALAFAILVFCSTGSAVKKSS